MSNLRTPTLWTILAIGSWVAMAQLPTVVHADDETPKTEEKQDDKSETPNPEIAEVSGSSSSSSGGSGGSGGSSGSNPALKETKSVDGLLKLHSSDTKLLVELSGSDYSNEYIVLISIARGIGKGSLLGGMSWGFGDDWVWKFRKVGDKVHIIRKNVRFTAAKGSPEESAVSNAYTDSVLFSLPISGKGPKGGDLVDLTPVFMSDLPQIGMSLPGFMFSASKSTFDEVKGFENNNEIRVAATYASNGSSDIDSVPDTRGLSVVVHYSISKVPANSYHPRLADPRVGYFLTVVKDYSKNSQEENFVRYINRWNLQPADPKSNPSPPKKPIVFWIENTVPYKYRKPIREGILEWNKAFEAAGIVNAIEVRQQPDNADWDPEDVNYNTFRWITASAGFAMGPSRVNPYTGEILDADIIFDADFLRYWKQEFETVSPEQIEAMTGGPLDPAKIYGENGFLGKWEEARNCRLSAGMSQQFAFGAAALLAEESAAADEKKAEEKEDKDEEKADEADGEEKSEDKADDKDDEKEEEKEDDAEKAKKLEAKIEAFIMQGLKDVAMHEVGHTLGLRHNFKASTYLSLEDMNKSENSDDCIVASVMDYNATNIVPKGKTQGSYFPTTIGVYDMWAIEYGYKPLSGGTSGEEAALKKIAAKSGKAGFAFTTDEDTTAIDPDPHSNRFDLGSDNILFAKNRAELVRQLMPGLVDRVTKDGDDYTQARRAFNVLLSQHGQGMFFASRYIGGVYTSRSFKGDEGADPPMVPVEATKQREALELLTKEVFSDDPFSFDADVYNKLGPSTWRHWGTDMTRRKDFPVHDVVDMWQDRILDQMLATSTLERMHDAELKIPADEDAFTTAELIESLTKAIFSELDAKPAGDYSTRKPMISSLRRNLQRNYLERLSDLALGNTGAPEDCQTVAYAELVDLEGKINQVLKGKAKLDAYTRAHLMETAARAKKVTDASITKISGF